MVYYKITAKICNYKELIDEKENKILPETFRNASMELLQQTKNECGVFVAQVDRRCRIECAVIGVDKALIEQNVNKYFELISMRVKELKIEETIFHFFWARVASAEHYDFIGDRIEIRDLFELKIIAQGHFGFVYRESLVSPQYHYEEVNEKADTYLCGNSLMEELGRIYQKPLVEQIKGNPVQYMICMDQLEVGYEIAELVIEALVSNERVEHQRYAKIEVDCTDYVDERELQSLYDLNKGGTMLVQFERLEDDESGQAGAETLVTLAKCMKKNRNKVQTIFLLEKSDTKSKEILMENIGHISMVHICDEVVYGERARKYLAKIAKEQGVTETESLMELITDEEKGYSAKDLHQQFDSWLDTYLKTSVYPQYADTEVARENVLKQKPSGSAYKELEQMIGLTEAKAVINQALDYYKAQKLFQDRGMESDHPAMHMVFTGSPGTAKTTVARLFARIMKENGILSRGDLYEVGRADLVGKYVGWTAQIVKEKFKAAKGSVLFIDEAYSLLDDRGGMYGDEAINTIVQEMENHRDDTVVIFAGYSDEMEKFLERNPGLRSRIAFHVPFADYNAEELCSIGELIAEKKGMHLGDGVKEKMYSIFEKASQQADFGNGRYVRNVMEKARMKQATRLMHMEVQKLTQEDVATFLEADFEIPTEKKEEKKKIGFVK